MSMIDFPAFTPEFAAAELPRLLEISEKAVAAIEGEGSATYEGLVWRLDDATRELWHVWGVVRHMLSVMNSDAWRKLEEAWQPKVVGFSLRVGQSKPIYAAAKKLLSVEQNPVRKRILAKMVEGAEHAGVALEGEKKSRFNEVQMRLAKLAADFQNSVIDATGAFKLEADGKVYTIDDANYPETMKHCANRDVRERLYRARVTRSPENSVRISEILKLRQEEAELLGFKEYAELSLVTKCAPSVAAVMKMIDELDEATKAKAANDFAELGGDKLKPWDIAFAAERLREDKYAYSEDELKRYFEVEEVVNGFFKLTNFLFGVEIVEVKGKDKPSVWHEDVRYFKVLEDHEEIAGFYFDPYVRSGQKSGGAWMNEFRNRRRNDTVENPLAVIVTNFPAPDKYGKCYLPFREVETVFHEFGHALQCMLTRVDEEDAAGINLVEWDAVEVASQFMENWCLDDRTGIVVPSELKAKVRAAKNFRAATACRRQLAFAKVDMLLHRRGTFAADELKREVFAHFGLPMITEDKFLCAFSHIFAGGYAAGYYGYKWAEVMSADCFGAFEEAGLNDSAAVAKLGRRYRETILALGGSKSALEVFQDFRGRNPEIKSLLRQQDLL